jgi:hypothetical protein
LVDTEPGREGILENLEMEPRLVLAYLLIAFMIAAAAFLFVYQRRRKQQQRRRRKRYNW